MTKMYLVEGKQYDIVVIPYQFACRLTKYYWVVVNQSDLEYSGLKEPVRKLKIPPMDRHATDNEITEMITKHFGPIVAVREDGTADQGFIAIDKEKFEKMIERHGIPYL